MKIKKLLTLLLSSAVILSSGVALAQESSSSSGGSGSSSGGSGSSSSGGGDDWGSGSPACSELSDRTNARCYVEPDDYVMHIIAFRLRKEDGSFLEFPASSTSIDFADGAACSELSDR
ncbi:MAG TPA: hypothetical protein DIV86_01090, partial [Alphaproteobacteria bacterium]|nr:hypothetical protein [Alphaproteobacteria bacterium]